MAPFQTIWTTREALIQKYVSLNLTRRLDSCLIAEVKRRFGRKDRLENPDELHVHSVRGKEKKNQCPADVID